MLAGTDVDMPATCMGRHGVASSTGPSARPRAEMHEPPVTVGAGGSCWGHYGGRYWIRTSDLTDVNRAL